MKIKDLPILRYEVRKGPAEGKQFEHRQTKDIQAMVKNGTLMEVKEKKTVPETKELKHTVETKVKKRKRVPRNHKN